MADEVVSHAFSHGYRADHSERLAAYWAEALGGPPLYTGVFGDETAVVRMHSGNGPHEEMDRRAIACFDQALVDVGLDERTRAALSDYFAWATTHAMAAYHESADDVPDGLPLPRWSWDGTASTHRHDQPFRCERRPFLAGCERRTWRFTGRRGQGAQEGGEGRGRGVDARLVAGRHEVEQQAAGDGEAEAGERRVDRAAGVLVGRVEPAPHGRREQPRERRLALRRPGVALEEQPLQGAQLGAPQVGPHRRERGRRVVGQRAEHGRLPPLDLLDHRDEQLVARSEVVQQHPVARADLLGDRAERPPADPVARERVDHGVEQLPAPRVVTRAGQPGARSAP